MFLTHDAILKQHLFYLMIMSPVVAKIGVNFIEGEKIVLQSLYKMSHFGHILANFILFLFIY